MVVGLQEAPSPVSSVIGIDPLCNTFCAELSKMEFVLLNSHRVSIMPGSWGLLTMLFVKRPLLCYSKNMKLSSIRTGIGGLLGNKGASIIKVTLGDLDVCFVNCHLPPHEENNEKRLQDLNSIFSEPCMDGETVMKYDIVVLLGDLNFRIQTIPFDEAVKMVGDGRLKELLTFDQLLLDQIQGSPSGSQLSYFLEAAIEFQPSYKYIPNSDTFSDGGKGRVPSWCDRVLWSMNKRLYLDVQHPMNRVQSTRYSLCLEPKLSDHRAVSAHFVVYTDLTATPLVVFEPTSWAHGQNAVISFEVSASVDVSSWDWVALYPRQFTSVQKDHRFWSYSPAKHCTTKAALYKIIVPADSIPSQTGYYMLLYYSRPYSSVIGMSPLFFIQ